MSGEKKEWQKRKSKLDILKLSLQKFKSGRRNILEHPLLLSMNQATTISTK